MPRTNIAPVLYGTSYYPTLPLAAQSADVTFVPADVVNMNSAPIVNGKTLLFAFNTGMYSHTVTIHSQPDPQNRTGDITDYVIEAGKIAGFGPFYMVGWANAGRLEFEASDAEVEFAVRQLP